MFEQGLGELRTYLERVRVQDAAYRTGSIHVRVPEGLQQVDRPLDDAIQACSTVENV